MDVLMYTLAAIGGIVVLLISLVSLYLLLGFVTVLVEKLFQDLSRKMFEMGGGRGHSHPEGQKWPDKPYDRLWIEFAWLSRVVKYVQMKLGYASYTGNPAERPDMEKFMQERKDSLSD